MWIFLTTCNEAGISSKMDTSKTTSKKNSACKRQVRPPDNVVSSCAGKRYWTCEVLEALDSISKTCVAVSMPFMQILDQWRVFLAQRATICFVSSFSMSYRRTPDVPLRNNKAGVCCQSCVRVFLMVGPVLSAAIFYILKHRMNRERKTKFTLYFSRELRSF